MMKRILLAAPFCLATLAATAQVEFRNPDLVRLNSLIDSGKTQELKFMKGIGTDASNRIEVIIRYDSESTLREIESRGGEIVSLVGYRTAIVSVDPKDAVAVAGSDGVSAARLSELVKRTNDKALPMSMVPDVWAGEYGLQSGYDGTGVIVGIFDTGIQPNHINFRDAEGKSRVSAVWNYTEATARPNEYLTPEDIANYSTDTRNESHGTHVLGIMSGSFHDTSDPDAPDYRGVAPGAEIIVTSGQGYNVQILDALERMGKYAQEKGKPCVVNLSFGDNMGPHDGTDVFTETINDIADKYDIVMCLASGNERDYQMSLIKTVTEENPYVRTAIMAGPSNESMTMMQAYGDIEVWCEDGSPFEVSLDVYDLEDPSDPVYSFEVPGTNARYAVAGNCIYFDPKSGEAIQDPEGFAKVYTGSYMGGVRGVNSINGRYCAYLDAYLKGISTAFSRQYYTVMTVKATPGKKIFVYCSYDYMSLGDPGFGELDVPTGAGTNSNMACGKNTISVGSYVSANRQGSGYLNAPLGSTSPFSSYGETGDGRVMPDVCAPGQVIISSKNSGSSTVYYPNVYTYTEKGEEGSADTRYYWTVCAGTSQASPHMAGIAALMRQANPTLKYYDIQYVVRNTSYMPSYGAGWGYGKADAFEAVKMAETFVSGSGVEAATLAGDSSDIKIEGDSVNGYHIYIGQGDVQVSVYDMNGLEVKRVSDSDGEVSLNVDGLGTGVYVLRVVTDSAAKTMKIGVR